MSICWIWESGCKGEDVAAWAQTIGTFLAIIGATGVAIYQSRSQHESAQRLQQEAWQYERAETTRTLWKLASNAQRLVKHVIGELNSRQAFFEIANHKKRFDLTELRRVEDAIIAIPLHSLPASLVSPTMILSSSLRQFRENVEDAILRCRTLDGSDFVQLFQVFGEICDVMDSTCDDIKHEVDIYESVTR